MFPDEWDGIRERTGSDAKRAFDYASLPVDVLREVEDCRLALAQRTHHLKPPDGRIGGLQRFETPHWTNQLLQLTVIGLDDIVQILDLSVHRLLKAFAFGLQL